MVLLVLARIIKQEIEMKGIQILFQVERRK